MKYTQIPAGTFEQIQLNAGILVDAFNPATGVIGNLLGATSGGINFTDTINTKDFGEDIDNCPKNTKELKKLESHEAEYDKHVFRLLAKFFRMLLQKLVSYAEILTAVIFVVEFVALFIESIYDRIGIFGPGPDIFEVHDPLGVFCHHLHVFACRVKDVIYEYIGPDLGKYLLKMLIILKLYDIKV